MHAVEPGAVQLVWSHLPTRSATVHLGTRRVDLDVPPPAWVHHRARPARRLSADPGGPGAVTLEGLAPGEDHRLVLEVGGTHQELGTIRTPAPPPGALLSRFATVSDTHIGERRFGITGDIREPLAARVDPYPQRCLRAALDEARAWGAQLLAVKGDLTWQSTAHEIGTVGALVAGAGLPAVYQPGNHDVYRPISLRDHLPSSSPVAEGDDLAVADLPGVRIVLVDTSVYRHRHGHLDADRIDAVAQAAAEADGAVAVCVHHPPSRHVHQLTYPPGIDRAASQMFLSALRRANPRVVVLAGHSHRYRCRSVDGVRVSEVGSTKDYPGGWAGYLVYEGGIVQTVRRTAAPEVMAWTEATATAVGGAWRRWSPGRLADRCWTQSWSP